MLNFDFLLFYVVLQLFVQPKKRIIKNAKYYFFVQTVKSRSRFIPLFKHFVKRHAEQRRRDSIVISQFLFRRHSNVA